MRARWNVLAAWLLVGALVSAAGGAAAQATDGGAAVAEGKVDLEELRTQRKARTARFPISSRVSRYLESAAEASDEGEPTAGSDLLDRLNPARLNPHERALVYRLRAFIAYAAGDAATAIEFFEKALDEQVLSIDADNKMRFSIAQLHASLQQWPEVIASLDRWSRYVEEPDPLAYYLRALAHYQMEEVDRAIADAEMAIDLSPDPKEGWLQLLAALFVQQKDYANAAPVLEELVIRFPKKEYWVQLSLIYAARDNYRESLAVQQVAYLEGFLTDDKEIRRLAQSYLYNDLPFPAAQVLEKGVADGIIEPDVEFYELLANSWIAAREYDRSLPPLEKAAELAEDGKLFVRLGQVRLQREEWDQATECFRRALERGGLDDVGAVRLLLGIAYYNDGKIDRAFSSFLEAQRHESTRARAESWITHIEKEIQAG